MIYDEYQMVAHNATYYDYSVGEQLPLDFTGICHASLSEAMKALDEVAIQKHLFGIAVLGKVSLPHWFEYTDVVAYAGVTGLEHYMGNKLAIIGGIIRLDTVEKQGLALPMVEKLCEVASNEAAIAQHGHKGFLARCNPDSQNLLKKLGFHETEEEFGKTIMLKML